MLIIVIVRCAPDSSLDKHFCGGTCKKSSDIDEGPQKPILKCYNPNNSAMNLSLEISTQPGINDIRG